MNNKMMMAFGAVAAMSATAFGDVTSANVVGYDQGMSAPGGSAKLVSIEFLGVGETDKCHLSDLKVTNYTPGDDGCWHGDFRMEVLNGGGRVIYIDKTTGLETDSTENSIDKSYYWCDDDDEYEPGWYDKEEKPLKNGASVIGDADKIEIAAGDALWVYGKSGVDLKLSMAGQVSESDLVLTAPGGAAKGFGVAFPASVMLSDVYVDNYIAGDDGCWHGDFRMEVLNGGGRVIYIDKTTGLETDSTENSIDKSYYWCDDDDEYEPGWYDKEEKPLKNGASVIGDADKIELNKGEGLWIYGKSGVELKVHFPCPYKLSK